MDCQGLSSCLCRRRTINSNKEEETFMTINNTCGVGVGYPCQTVQTESSAGNGLVAGAGFGAATIGGATLWTGLRHGDQFKALIKTSRPENFQPITNGGNKISQGVNGVAYKGNHLWNFVQDGLKTVKVRNAVIAAAATAVGAGLTAAAWTYHQNSQKLTRLNAENSFLAATIPPMDTTI
jgi:hypothetical protein